MRWAHAVTRAVQKRGGTRRRQGGTRRRRVRRRRQVMALTLPRVLVFNSFREVSVQRPEVVRQFITAFLLSPSYTSFLQIPYYCTIIKAQLIPWISNAHPTHPNDEQILPYCLDDHGICFFFYLHILAARREYMESLRLNYIVQGAERRSTISNLKFGLNITLEQVS